MTAPDVVREAHQLYQVHRTAAKHDSKRRNLDLLWQVLEDIRSEGGRDYCLAEVGRRLASLGGPKTQSLRNTQGAHFRDVITAYAAAVGGSTKHVAQNRTQVDAALYLITDLSIRATIRMAIDEGRRLKVVNDNLHAAFKTLHIGSLPSVAPFSVMPTQEPSATSGEPKLSPRLVTALRKGIDPSRLAERGFLAAEDGSICDGSGSVLFPPAFVTAIMAILAACE